MNAHRVAAATAAAVILCAGGCGTSGSLAPRPIETLLYVSGGPGLTFTFATTADQTACGSDGIGIQAPNASHQFGARVFQTPYLFVMENIKQPVRAVIQNTSSLPIRVDLYLGQTPQQSNVTIDPGQCKTIATNDTLLDPKPSGAEIQVEVCSPINASGNPDLRISCPDSTDDRNIAYFATIGDVKATNITNCFLPATPLLLDACRSPSTFFLEQPKDEIDAIMNVNSGQNPGPPIPTAELRLELYVNGQFSGFQGGTNPVVSKNL